MRKIGRLLVLLCPIFGITGARAADYTVQAQKNENYQPPSWAPTFSVVGTISATWTDNAFFSRNDRRSDWFIEPDITARMDGRLTPDLTYRFYIRTELDAFARVKDADEAFALWGARLTRNVG